MTCRDPSASDPRVTIAAACRPQDPRGYGLRMPVPLAFSDIHPIGGSRDDAFEALVCLLARAEAVASGERFRVLHGAGGDGGVECFTLDREGAKRGWQAKFTSDFASALTKAKGSLRTAMRVHPTLREFVLCVPFDLTGPRGLPEQSQWEKWDGWKAEMRAELEATGTHCPELIPWVGGGIAARLLADKRHAGILALFFGRQPLDEATQDGHLRAALATAGPRFSSAFNVDHRTLGVVHAFAGTPGHDRDREAWLQRHLVEMEALERATVHPPKPTELCRLLRRCERGFRSIADRLRGLAGLPPEEAGRGVGRLLRVLPPAARRLSLASATFRRAAEEEEDDAAASQLRHAAQALNERWLSVSRTLRDDFAQDRRWAEEPLIAVGGDAGSGKTHVACKVFRAHVEAGGRGVLVFGEQFLEGSTPEACILRRLRPGAGAGAEGLPLLEELSVAAEVSGRPGLVVIDALDECGSPRYWKQELPGFRERMRGYPNLRLVLTCRTEYRPFVFGDDPPPEDAWWRCTGFEEDVPGALRRHSLHFKTATPPELNLSTEASNPLLLRLVYEEKAKRERKGEAAATGFSMTAVFERLVARRRGEILERQGPPLDEESYGAALDILLDGWIDSGAARIGADTLRRRWRKEGISGGGELLRRLAEADLVRRAPGVLAKASSWSEPNSEDVSPAFGRIGDLMIASRLLRADREPTGTGIRLSSRAAAFLIDADGEPAVGPLVALAALLPGSEGGMSLLNIERPRLDEALTLVVVVRSMSLQAPEELGEEVLGFVWPRLHAAATEEPGLLRHVLFAVARASGWQTNSFLGWLRSLGLVERDALLTPWLMDGEERRSGALKPLLAFAAAERPRFAPREPRLHPLLGVACVLAALSGSSDRRAWSRCVRGLEDLLGDHPGLLVPVVERFLHFDDDWVRENVLGAAYACVLQHEPAALDAGPLASCLLGAYAGSPESFANSVLRDLVHRIAFLVERRGQLPDGRDAFLPLHRPEDPPSVALPKPSGGGPPPSQRLRWSCFHDDFHCYTLNELSGWEEHVSKDEAAAWIFDHVSERMGHRGSEAAAFDDRVPGFKGGRGRDHHLERIGKKYQHVALKRLASLLHDRFGPAVPHASIHDEETPLISAGLHGHDPTLRGDRLDHLDEKREDWVNCAWTPWFTSVSLHEDAATAAFLHATEDLPSAEHVLAGVDHAGGRMVPLAARPVVRKPFGESQPDAGSRSTWLDLRAFLIDSQMEPRLDDAEWVRRAAAALGSGRGSEFCGVLGEACPELRPEAEDRESFEHAKALERVPGFRGGATRRVLLSQEADPSAPGEVETHVPADPLIQALHLRWVPRRGFCRGAECIAFDPQLTHHEEAGFLIRRNALLGFLKSGSHRLLIRLRGERLEVTPRFAGNQRRNLLLLAILDASGAVRSSPWFAYGDQDRFETPRG